MMPLRRLKRLDWPVVVAVFALIAFTWPYMHSASYRSGPNGQGWYTSSPQKQLVWVGVSVVAALVLLVPGYRAMSEFAVVLYLGGLAMLVAVLCFGRTINGARSWLVLSESLRLQPAELVKITTLIALAHYLGRKRAARRFGRVLGALALAAVPAVLIAAQPDLGTALMFVPTSLAMIFVAGARLKHLGVLAGVGLVLLPALWLGMTGTQRARITTWLRQGETLTQAERVGRFHHQIQSRVAIASGRLTGKGLGNGTQNRLNYVGFRNTDFIFAVICEEAGFIGAMIVIGLYLFLAYAGLSIAQRCREPVGRLLAVGAVVMFIAQGFVNIGMTVGALPIVGITLPFVSYGGSSTLASFVAVSLLLNVGLRRPKVTFSREELGAVALDFGG
jgi:rod shape determining protein RodA